MDLEGKGKGICFGAEYVLALSSIFALAFVGFGSSATPPGDSTHIPL